jgi:hypothetical protein
MPYGTPTNNGYQYRATVRHDATGVYVDFMTGDAVIPGPEPESELDAAFQEVVDLMAQTSGWTLLSGGKTTSVFQETTVTP